MRRLNPRNRISHSMSSRISSFIRKEQRSWTTMVPYSFEELISHLQAQFTPEMTMDNYGSYWHIDHIRPISSFEFEKETDEGFQECWSLKNLRPLPAIENLVKGSRWNPTSIHSGETSLPDDRRSGQRLPDTSGPCESARRD